MIFRSIMIFCLFIDLNPSPTQDWVPYYNDKKISISYTSKVCSDKVYNFSFEYYLLKIKNKTDKTIVVNFNKGLSVKEETKIAFVLNPLEIITGSCDYNVLDLKIFKRETDLNLSKKTNDIYLTNIQIIEVN